MLLDNEGLTFFHGNLGDYLLLKELTLRTFKSSTGKGQTTMTCEPLSDCGAEPSIKSLATHVMQRDVFHRKAVRRIPKIKPNSSIDVGRLNQTSPMTNSNEKIEKESPKRLAKRNSETALGRSPLAPVDTNKIASELHRLQQRNSDPHGNR